MAPALAMLPSSPSCAVMRRQSRPQLRLTTIVKAQMAMAKMPAWDDVHRTLLEKKLKSISAVQAQNSTASKEWVMLDVRPRNVYSAGHIDGAQSAPLYQPLDLSELSVTKAMKFLLFALNGVAPIEPNPSFLDQVKDAVADGQGVIVYCENGGTMTATTNFSKGKASRSLQAAFAILDSGLTDKVMHLDGGAFSWYRAGLPFTGEYDPSNAGKSPNTAAAPSGYFIDGEGARGPDKKP